MTWRTQVPWIFLVWYKFVIEHFQMIYTDRNQRAVFCSALRAEVAFFADRLDLSRFTKTENSVVHTASGEDPRIVWYLTGNFFLWLSFIGFFTFWASLWKRSSQGARPNTNAKKWHMGYKYVGWTARLPTACMIVATIISKKINHLYRCDTELQW